MVITRIPRRAQPQRCEQCRPAQRLLGLAGCYFELGLTGSVVGWSNGAGVAMRHSYFPMRDLLAGPCLRLPIPRPLPSHAA